MLTGRLPLLVVAILQLPLLTWGKATLAPPSTFPTLPSSTSEASNSTVTIISVSSSGSLSAAVSSSTQFPSLSGFSSCVTDCFADAVSSANCSTLVDVNCFCSSRKFSPALVGCIAGNCTSDQVTTGENLAQQFCNLASSSPTLSFPVISTSATLTSLPDSSLASSSLLSTLTSPPANSSSSGVHPYSVELRNVFSMFITLLGVLLGICSV